LPSANRNQQRLTFAVPIISSMASITLRLIHCGGFPPRKSSHSPQLSLHHARPSLSVKLSAFSSISPLAGISEWGFFLESLKLSPPFGLGCCGGVFGRTRFKERPKADAQGNANCFILFQTEFAPCV